MQKANEYITYTFNELAEVMKNIEVMLQSYHRIISYYAIDINEDLEKFDENEFRKEITDFICKWDVPKRLADIGIYGDIEEVKPRYIDFLKQYQGYAIDFPG